MKTHFKIFLLFILGTFVITKACSQETGFRLDSFFRSLYQYGQINGNVLIAEQGNIIYKRSFGFSDFETKTPNSDSTCFTLASVSKVFTSTAILQLRDKGKINLDNPVTAYLPDFPYPGITVRNLLSHTSGLPDYQLYEEEMNKNPDKIFTNADILPSLKKWNKPLSFKPGDRWEYSNTNFCLLALLVEKVSGMVFQQYIQKYIFIPIKMYDTYFLTDPKQVKDKYRAINYEFPFLYSDKYQMVDTMKKYHWREYNASGFVGQGNIIITAMDLLKFDDAIYSGKILKPSTLAEAFTPTKLNNGQNNKADIGIGKASYGLGWFIFTDTSAGKIVWHTGGQPGALSIFLRNISKKQTVIMFGNTFNRSIYGNGVNAMAILNNQFIIPRKKSLTQDYGITLVEKGTDAAFCKLQNLIADSSHYYLSESDMNDLGLQLLYTASFDKDNKLALEVLKINTLLFPKSFNTYDSYGEALLKAGKKAEAIFMYKRSIELNPNNEGGKEALKQLSAN